MVISYEIYETRQELDCKIMFIMWAFKKGFYRL